MIVLLSRAKTEAYVKILMAISTANVHPLMLESTATCVSGLLHCLS